MSEKPNEPTLHDHDVAIKVKMPGQMSVNTYHITVKATGISDAMYKGITEWKRITEPTDIQVKAVKEEKKSGGVIEV
jgi:hypothetical protein